VRTPLFVANWKMHKTHREARNFAAEFLSQMTGIDAVEIALAPPFTALSSLAEVLRGSPVQLAAQNVHPEREGAFTGEVSAVMLRELGCRYCIVGHSERRSLFGETSDFVAQKARALIAAGLRPIVCVGETLAEREAGRTSEVVGRQLRESLAGFARERAAALVIAYEPVWAIGTGRTATPELAQETHAGVRSELTDLFGEEAAHVRIQYGGSVKPENVAQLMAQPDIDGALVGGASLVVESFARIVRFRAASPATAARGDAKESERFSSSRRKNT